ncbi:2'-5' RNA ligase family protein [Streptomyces flavidovirens]|uniref:2'-5' RNA ligase family protein n=1 Tax=Streptomyces flavidovirens TaxID=67298 RepID=A0ABW6R8J2_9ACTN
MKDFWSSHQWPPSERRVHWHLLFQGEPDVHRFAHAHADLLSRYPQLTHVPVEWLHATIQSIGPLTDEQSTAVAEAGRAVLADLQPFDIEIGPAHAIHNGVVVDLYPEENLSIVYWALRKATEGVVGPDALPPAPELFWPHLSLAYSNTRWSDDDLKRALAKEVRPSRARMTVERVVLVEQQQDWRRLYSWTAHATIPLGRALPITTNLGGES